MNENCLLICGDFNVSLSDIDRKTPNSDKSRPVLRDFVSYLDVIDSVRALNKTKVMFTYSNANCTIQSRIDYILCSQYVMGLAKKSYVLRPPKVPDHRAVILKLHPDIKCGPGYWKLNVSHLQDINYSQHIKKTIDDTKAEYSNILDKRQLWDYCKYKIKEESIF